MASLQENGDQVEGSGDEEEADTRIWHTGQEYFKGDLSWQAMINKDGGFHDLTVCDLDHHVMEDGDRRSVGG